MKNSVGICLVLEPQEMSTRVVTRLNQKRLFPFPDSSSSSPSTGSSASSEGSSVSSKGSLSSTGTAVMGTGSKYLYIFYKHYSFSKYSHSLYKIEVDLEIPTTGAPIPILDFPADEYPWGMSCARLGSKLYFLGGSRDFVGGRMMHREVLSRDVYVFDTSTSSFKKIDSCLNAGKYDCILFAANGKLYVLAYIPDLPISELLSLSLFECFDPITNKWQVLDNLPPLKNKCVNWMGCTVLGKHQQVVLVGVEGATKLVKFIFHVHQQKWTRHALHDVNGSETFSFSETLSFQEGGHENYLYGLRNWGPPVKSRLGVMGALSGNDQVDISAHKSIPVIPTTEGRKWAKGVNSYFGQFSGEETSRSLRYLGKDYFIYIASGSPCGDGYLSPDFYTQGISLTLFKEEEKNQEGDEKLHFRADILHSKSYKFQIQDCTAKLVASFVIAPEKVQKRLDMMEDKKKKKNKKNKKYMKNKKKKKNDHGQSFGDTSS